MEKMIFSKEDVNSFFRILLCDISVYQRSLLANHVYGFEPGSFDPERFNYGVMIDVDCDYSMNDWQSYTLLNHILAFWNSLFRLNRVREHDATVFVDPAYQCDRVMKRLAYIFDTY